MDVCISSWEKSLFKSFGNLNFGLFIMWDCQSSFSVDNNSSLSHVRFASPATVGGCVPRDCVIAGRLHSAPNDQALQSCLADLFPTCPVLGQVPHAELFSASSPLLISSNLTFLNNLSSFSHA